MEKPQMGDPAAYADNWHFWFNIFRSINVVILFIITAGSIAVGANSSDIISGARRNQLAFVVALCSALYGTFQPAGQARAYRAAWQQLSATIRDSTDKSQLNAAITEGEKILAGAPEPMSPDAKSPH
jgi:hypothetical protein